jgi:DNA end-binding protein Ku
VREGVIVLQTLLWADEVRQPEFEFLSEDTQATDRELAMAASLVDSLAGDYEPDEFEDDYSEAVEALVASKIEGGELKEAPAAQAEETEVVDLLAALQRSVDKAKAAKSGGTSTTEIREEAAAEQPAETARKAPAKKSAAKKAPAKKTAAKKTTTKKAASKRKAS